MKVPCEVIRDLLLMYSEGACSEESKKLVEEHLAECKGCQDYLEKLRIPEGMVVFEENLEAEEQALIKKCFKKIKRRWVQSLAAILLILPFLGLGIMTCNEVRGEGICFSNLNDIWICKTFFQRIEKGEYEKAVEMLDLDSGYFEVQETMNQADEDIYQWYCKIFGDVPNMTQEEFLKRRQEDILAKIESLTVEITSVRYYEAYRAGSDWVIGISITEKGSEGEERNTSVMYFGLRGGKMELASWVGEWNGQDTFTKLPALP